MAANNPKHELGIGHIEYKENVKIYRQNVVKVAIRRPTGISKYVIRLVSKVLRWENIARNKEINRELQCNI